MRRHKVEGLRALIKRKPYLVHERFHGPGATLLEALTQPENAHLSTWTAEILIEFGSELDVPPNLAACFNCVELVKILVAADVRHDARLTSGASLRSRARSTTDRGRQPTCSPRSRSCPTGCTSQPAAVGSMHSESGSTHTGVCGPTRCGCVRISAMSAGRPARRRATIRRMRLTRREPERRRTPGPHRAPPDRDPRPPTDGALARRARRERRRPRGDPRQRPAWLAGAQPQGLGSAPVLGIRRDVRTLRGQRAERFVERWPNRYPKAELRGEQRRGAGRPLPPPEKRSPRPSTRT